MTKWSPFIDDSDLRSLSPFSISAERPSLLIAIRPSYCDSSSGPKSASHFIAGSLKPLRGFRKSSSPLLLSCRFDGGGDRSAIQAALAGRFLQLCELRGATC